MRLFPAILLLVALSPAVNAGGSHHSSRASSHSTAHRASNHARAAGVVRDNHGHITRSTRAKDEFKRGHPCPATGKSSGPCHGYVIDHVVPLKRGGPDAPGNMQWQTVEAAKAKDKVE